MFIYFDAPSGIAGDMLVASLIDAGVDFEYIQKNIDILGLDVELSFKEKLVNGIKSKMFIVNIHKDEDAPYHPNHHQKL